MSVNERKANDGQLHYTTTLVHGGACRKDKTCGFNVRWGVERGAGQPGARTSTQPAEPATTHLRMESSSETTLLRPEIPSMHSGQTRTEA